MVKASLAVSCAVAAITGWTACGGSRGSSEGGQDGGNAPALELRSNIGIPMANVSGFVIAQGTATHSLSASLRNADVADAGVSQSQLWAIGKDGSLTVVTVTTTQEADGGTSSSSSTQTATPLAVFDTAAYVLFAYDGVTHNGTNCNLIPVSKSDGSMYCVSLSAGPYMGWSNDASQYWSPVQSDATGKVIWVAIGSGVVRLDMTDPSNPTQSTQIPNGCSQAVNASGDDLVSCDGPSAGDRFTRVLRQGGGFVNVSAYGSSGYPVVECLAAGGPSEPNDFHYLVHGEVVGPDSHLYKLTRAADGSFGPQSLLATTSDANCRNGLARSASHIFMASGASGQTSPFFIDIDLSNETPTVQTVSAFSQITWIAGCDTALFLLGKDANGNGGIVKYDPATRQVSTLLAPGAYALTTMSVSPSCEVTFHGQRASDGAYILGNIPANGTTVTVIATGFPTVSQIQRIN